MHDMENPNTPPSGDLQAAQIQHLQGVPMNLWPALEERARKSISLADIGADLLWRPFLLHPESPGEAGFRKPGGADRARRLHATLADLGRAEGVPLVRL